MTLEFPLVLLYHRVANVDIDNQYLSVSPQHFEEHLAFLTRHYKVIPLYDMIQASVHGKQLQNTVAITFDDGYADNLYNALPLLEKYSCHATIFVTSGLVDNHLGFWYDVLEDVLLTQKKFPQILKLKLLNIEFPLRTVEERFFCHEALVNNLHNAHPRVRELILKEFLLEFGIEPDMYRTPHPLLSADEVGRLAASSWIELGGHTLHHPVLSHLSLAEQRREITGGALQLRSFSGKKPRLFAYPFGNQESFTSDTCRLVAESGFIAGIANYQGSVTPRPDVWRIPRRLVRDWDGMTFRRWLVRNDKDALEVSTLAGREAKILDLLHRHCIEGTGPLPLAGALKDKSICAAPYRITHINTCLGQGGAAKVVELLMRVQKALGLEPKALVGESYIMDDAVCTFDAVPDLCALRTTNAEGLLDYHFRGSHALICNEAVLRADVLHLHNLHGGYFNPFSLPLLARNKPVVWTLHDMQPLTGHCAHSFDCQRWRTGCGLCPYLGTYPPVETDNTHHLWRDKLMLYDAAPIWLAAPSRWLANMLPASILARHPVTVIPNGIDTSCYKPLDKSEARRQLGLPEHGLIVGNAAAGGPLNNVWKGGSYALAVMEALRAVRPDALFVGRGNRETSESQGLHLLPYTGNEDDMCVFYAALDFLLYPSIADNCPLTVLEAQACGIPVLAFAVGGIPEIVEDGLCGLIVRPRDTEALAAAALRLAGDDELVHRLGGHARERAEKDFDARLMAERYVRFYEEAKAGFRKGLQGCRAMHSKYIALQQGIDYVASAQACGALVEDRAAADIAAEGLIEPVSRVFGLDRGMAIDRVYIENFLCANRAYIRGKVLEIADNTYTLRFGTGVTQSDVLHAVPSEQATIVGNLEDAGLLPDDFFDCIILTQTLHVIYNAKTVLRNIAASLAPGGSLLLTVPCISQISRYDMERWGDFWRFTDKGLGEMLKECMPGCTIAVEAVGNFAISIAFLAGRSAEEVDPSLFSENDADYQMLVTARVTRDVSTSDHGIILKRQTYHKKESQLMVDSQKYYPSQLAIEPVHGCNAHCIMCPQKNALRPKGILKTAHLSLMLEKIRQWGAPISLITHAGLGEPLLDKELEQKILRDKAIFPHAKVIVYSNGALLTLERARSLLESGVDVLSFSLNALHATTYHHITGLNREVTYTNILNLLELRERLRAFTQVNVSCIPIAELTEQEQEEFKNFWRGKVNGVVVPPVINWGGDWGAVEKSTTKRLPCNFIFSVLMVDWDGTVKRCCEDYDSKYPMGNLLNQDPSEIFNSIMMTEQRKSQIQDNFFMPPICRYCVETFEEVAGPFWSGGGPIPC